MILKENLNLNKLLNLSQSISKEMTSEKIIKKFMSHTVEMLEPTKAIFIFPTEKEKYIYDSLNNNIYLDTNFNINPYIDNVMKTKKILLTKSNTVNCYKSILCIPLIDKATLIGILYLENDTLDSYFTNNDIEVVSILSSQTIISLKNAVKYKNLLALYNKSDNHKSKQLNYIQEKYKNTIEEHAKIEKRLLNCFPDSLIIHKDGFIKYINPAGLKLLGAQSSEEILGLHVKDFLLPEYHSIVDGRINYLKGKNRIVSPMLQKIITKTGKTITIGVQGFSFEYEGIDTVLTIITNITEIENTKKLKIDIKNKKRQLKEVLEYDKLKTEFVANISHELRTPLNLILGSLQMFDLVNKNNAYKNKINIDKYKTTIRQNCYRLLRLINNLIDSTKLDAGFIKLNLKKCNIVSIIEDISLSVSSYIENNGLHLTFDTDIEEKIMYCDIEKLERILLNLLSNAVKFSKPGGDINVLVTDLHDKISIIIEDNGIGIPNDKQDSIFNRFIQIDKSLTRNQEGSGLGLSIVKSLVEILGGTIKLESVENRGSKFIIILPEKISKSDIKKNSEICLHTIDKEKISFEFSDVYLT